MSKSLFRVPFKSALHTSSLLFILSGKTYLLKSKNTFFMDYLWKDFLRTLKHSKDKKHREMARFLKRFERGELTSEELRAFLVKR